MHNGKGLPDALRKNPTSLKVDNDMIMFRLHIKLWNSTKV